MNSAYVFAVLWLLTGQVGKDGDVTRKEMVKMLQPFYRSVAATYEFKLPGEGDPKAKLVTKPIYTWTGQEGGLVSGDVFVWTYKGRPEVVGCIGSLPGNGRRGVFHEFHSLTTDEKLPAVKLATGRRWAPSGVGIVPKEVPGAGAPSDRAPLRMQQMRRIARKFTSRMKASSQSGQERGTDNLRLQPQPLRRHDPKAIKEHPTVIDGAIFSYVWQSGGTDPELLLLIEARETGEGTKWFYAPVRFTFRQLWLMHDGDEVWHHPGGNGRSTYREPYITEFEGSHPIEEIRRLAESAEK